MNQVVIEKLIHGGLGLARTSSGVIFVSDCLPGETVEFIIDGKLQGVPLARPLSIVQPSEKRRTPNCPYFGECGGCDWLHIDYDLQVQIKKEIFIDCLKRIGKIKEIPEIECFSSQEFDYRIRAQLKIDRLGNCGFFRKMTHDVVKIERCPLLTPKCNAILKSINGTEHGFTEDTVKIIAGNCAVASDPVLDGMTDCQTDISVGKNTFIVYGDSFFQSNRFLIEFMGNWASPMVQGDYCVDLYGGTGFFSVMLGKCFAKGMLVESVLSQVELAKHNFATNGCSHFSAVCSDAERISSVVRTKPDLLIVDPPRTGLAKDVRKSIVSVAPSKVLYISCNPSTQARDVSVFLAAGYSISHAALFDCYPNTHHIETALLLEKRTQSSTLRKNPG
jgi:23S rRNA (uracil1939-C5)-methyltransferase